MEINLKDTLRTLRRKKNITQETLADYLGITPQSVGKWERGEGYPDITMLPKIAIYFDVTVDELLDVGQARIEERIQAYQKVGSEYSFAGENEKIVSLWEKAYKEFPNDCRVMSALMTALGLEPKWTLPKERADRIIALGERILQESHETNLRENAIQTLCFTYKRLEDDERALYYADKGGSFYCTREHLFSFAQEGEEGVKATQDYILSLITGAVYAAAYDLVRKGDYTAEENILIYEFGISLMKMPFANEKAGFYARDISRLYSLIAYQYATAENAEKTLEALENAKNYAVIASGRKAENYTTPLVNRIEYDPAKYLKNYRGNACDLCLEDLKRKEFDFVRGHERFLEVEKELKKNAEDFLFT